MSVIWILALALTAATLAFLLVPLLRRSQGPVPARAEFDMAVYRDQLAEVDRDLERGLLDAEQAEAARIEVKRRMLAAAGEPPAPGSESSRPGRPLVSTVAVAALVPAAAFGLYLVLGMPQAPDRPLAARPAPAETARSPSGEPGSLSPEMSMEEAVALLASRLEADPRNLEGWLLLGRSYLSMERYPDAAEAYREAYALEPGRADVASAYGEALVAVADGQVTADARAAFEAAAARDPLDPRARYYMALFNAQRGDVKAALQGWVDLRAVSPPDSPWLPVVNQQIARAARELGVDPAGLEPSAEVRALVGAAALPGPGQADMDAAAALSGPEREAMVRSMVDRLASRLEAEPGDLAGWQRLARAYDVLGETEKANDARARIEALQNR